MGGEADDGEDDETGEDAGEAVEDADEDCVSETVVAELVVGGEGDEAAPADAERKEDLRGGCLPHCRVQQLLEVWLHVEPDSFQTACKHKTIP